MAASATLALNAGAWVRRARLVMVAPDPRHTRRSQAETPLIDLSEFGQPPLPNLFSERVSVSFDCFNSEATVHLLTIAPSAQLRATLSRRLQAHSYPSA